MLFWGHRQWLPQSRRSSGPAYASVIFVEGEGSLSLAVLSGSHEAGIKMAAQGVRLGWDQGHN